MAGASIQAWQQARMNLASNQVGLREGRKACPGGAESLPGAMVGASIQVQLGGCNRQA